MIRVALWLLARLLPADDRDALIGDIVEAMHHERRPRRWLWRQAVAALWHTRPRFDLHRGTGMRSFITDLRHGARLLRRAPLFTITCTLTLGLAIGATGAIVSVVNPILLRPLPYPHAERLAIVWEREQSGKEMNVGWETFHDLATQSRSIASAAAVGDWQPTLVADGEGEQLTGERVSSTYFSTLGVRPALGRDFSADDDAQGHQNVVILSDGLWRRRFGARRDVIGQSIELNGNPTVVLGVMPRDFDNVVGQRAQIWRVLGYDATLPFACRTCRHLRMIARLRDGVSPERANAELDQLKTRMIAEHPRDYPAPGVIVAPLQDDIAKHVRGPLLALLGATALVLLIAAANVTNLQLARAARREDEFAIRAALGAGRGRLAQQLLAEGVLLAALGGGAGIVIARAVLPALVARLPEQTPRLAAIHLDAMAIAILSALTLTLGVAIGLLPARHGGGTAMFGALRDRARFGGRAQRRVRASLVIGEVALALVLLTGAGLMARSLVALLSVDAGFDPSHLLTLQVNASGPRYQSDASVYAFHDRVRDAVAAIPGVRSVGLASQLPLSGDFDTYGVAMRDKPLANPELAPSADRYIVSAGFLETMRTPLLRGRSITAMDTRDSADKVIVLSAALAERLWPGEDPLGKQVQLGGPRRPWRTVVGIVSNVRHHGLDDGMLYQAYVPLREWQDADNQMTLVVRADGDPASLAPAVRRTIAAVDPTVPISRVSTMDNVVSRSTAQRQLALTLFAAFGILAIVLAAAGIYGVLAGTVTERTREIGVRTALGATPRDILRLVIRDGLGMTAIGVALGLAGAIATTRFLSSLLFAVRPTDPFTLVVVIAVLGLVALAACLVPARRAANLDPVSALRSD